MSETNQLRWIGARPVYPIENIQVHPGPFETSVAGKTRTQINKSVEKDDDLEVIHWVTAGKILYLVACTCSADSVPGGITHLFVLDEREDDVFILIDIQTAAAQAISKSIHFPVPIKVPPPWGVALYCEVPHGAGAFSGWEE